MVVVNSYGYERGSLIANWGCPSCHRVLYHRTLATDVDLENRLCGACRTATNIAEQWSKQVWSLLAGKRTYNNGVYGLRDDTRDYLIGLSLNVPDRLKRLVKWAKRNWLNISVPGRVIPYHTPEF